MPATGGEPRRLTSHPGPDFVDGWSPDGKSVLFTSTRTSATDPPKLFTVSADGGFPTELPLPMASAGAFAPDGPRIAVYAEIPVATGVEALSRRPDDGGLDREAERLVDRKDPARQFERLQSRCGSDDRIYFLSDRDGPVSLFVYDTETKKVSEVVHNDGLDFKSASAHGRRDCLRTVRGSCTVTDLVSGRTKKVDVRISAQLPELQPAFREAGSQTHSQREPLALGCTHASSRCTAKSSRFRRRKAISAT